MTDLIWIGNTLYPRWVVLMAFAAIALGLLAISAFVRRFIND